jgi:hypothetical protein
MSVVHLFAVEQKYPCLFVVIAQFKIKRFFGPKYICNKMNIAVPK